MKLVWNLVRKASSCCRRERPLNGKRMHPSVAEDQNETSQIQDTTNVVLETIETDVLNNKLSLLVESQTVIVLDGEDHFNGESQALSKMEVDNQVEMKTNYASHDETADKKSETSNRNVGDRKNNSDVEATSAGDGAAGFSSEDSENDDHELEGEHPQKKRKLNTDGVLEEDRITQEWDNDMKLIKRNLGRISRLFEVYDGYRDKKKPLTINSDLIIHESVIDGKNTPAGNSLELAKLQASLVSLPSPAKILGRQQLLDSFKQVTEGMMPQSTGKTSAKRSVSFEQIIDVSNKLT